MEENHESGWDTECPIETVEKIQYGAAWSDSAANLAAQGCYAWMAERLRPIEPKRVLDVGCGAGQGLLALLNAFSPQIIALEENASCIARSLKALEASRYKGEEIYRLDYSDPSAIAVDQSDIVASEQITLIHADSLNPDPALLRFLKGAAPFDAVTLWLMGTDKERRTGLGITDPDDYRIMVQTGIYTLADQILRPGGLLQIVDRGALASSQLQIDGLLQSHRARARHTTLQVIDFAHREYKEVANRGIEMVGKPGADLSRLAIHSVIARKSAPKMSVFSWLSRLIGRLIGN
jgi:SAM-dependent methyltransferase